MTHGRFLIKNKEWTAMYLYGNENLPIRLRIWTPKKIPDFFLFNSKILSSKKINSNTNYRKLSCDNHIYNIKYNFTLHLQIFAEISLKHFLPVYDEIKIAMNASMCQANVNVRQT